MGSEYALIERAEHVRLPLLGPHALVLDTMVIYDDIVRRLRRNQPTTALVRSAGSGATRLFAASHVYDEMYDNIGRFERRSVSRDNVLREFERVYLPICRFVDMPKIDLDLRVTRVAEVDASDVPTAALALLIAPCDVLTRDSHLLDAGFGAKNWLSRVFEAEDLLGVDAATVGIALLAGEAGRRIAGAVGDSASSMLELLRTSEPARVVVAGVGGAVLACLTMQDPEAAAGVLRRCASGVGKTALGGLQIAAEPARRRTALHSAAVSPNDATTPAERIARLLVPTPLAVDEIDRRLSISAEVIETALQRHTAFVEAGGRWSVGALRAPRSRCAEIDDIQEMRPLDA